MRETVQSVGKKLDDAIKALKEIHTDSKSGALPAEFAARIDAAFGVNQPQPATEAPRLSADDVRKLVLAELSKLKTAAYPDGKGGANVVLLKP